MNHFTNKNFIFDVVVFVEQMALLVGFVGTKGLGIAYYVIVVLAIYPLRLSQWESHIIIPAIFKFCCDNHAIYWFNVDGEGYPDPAEGLAGIPIINLGTATPVKLGMIEQPAQRGEGRFSHCSVTSCRNCKEPGVKLSYQLL